MKDRSVARQTDVDSFAVEQGVAIVAQRSANAEAKTDRAFAFAELPPSATSHVTFISNPPARSARSAVSRWINAIRRRVHALGRAVDDAPILQRRGPVVGAEPHAIRSSCQRLRNVTSSSRRHGGGRRRPIRAAARAALRAKNPRRDNFTVVPTSPSSSTIKAVRTAPVCLSRFDRTQTSDGDSTSRLH